MSSQDPYNRGGFIAFLFSFIFSIAFFIYCAFIYEGIDLGEVKARVEKDNKENSQPATTNQ